VGASRPAARPEASPTTWPEPAELRRALRDLVALSTLPALWIGHSPSAILESLADAVCGTLRLDVAYVRLGPTAGAESIEAVCIRDGLQRGAAARELADRIVRTLDDGAPGEGIRVVPNWGGVDALRLLARSLGPAGGGILAVGSPRPDFPTEIEQLLLQVATNQATIAVRGAELIAEREHARAAAEAAVIARDEFLSVASHELKTPVAGIKGTAQLLERAFHAGRLDDARLARYIEMIDTAANRLGGLTNDLLDVSRLRTGQMPMHTRHLDLPLLVQEIVARWRERWPERQVSLDLPTEAPILADPDRLDQVLTNLLENAAKYSTPDTPIHVSLRRADEQVVLAVHDEGIGLPPGAHERIFEPFGRARNALEQHLPGLGLGLYICRRIVEQHGGRIWAESAGEGRGSAFRVALPADRGAAQ
jgi:signal transduction histidine kinase